MCYGVARPESAAGSSPDAVASTVGCAVFLGFRFEVLRFPFGGSALCLTLYGSRQNTGFVRWAKSRALYQ